MMQQQANELVGGEIIAAAIHAADAVGVAIGDEANVVGVLLKKRRAAPVVLSDGLRVNAAEKDVVLGVQSRYPAGGAGEQFFEAAGANAEEGIMGKAEPGLGDELEVHEPFDSSIVGGPDVLDYDLPGSDRVGQGNGPDRLLIQELLPRPGTWQRRRIRRNAT